MLEACSVAALVPPPRPQHMCNALGGDPARVAFGIQVRSTMALDHNTGNSIAIWALLASIAFAGFFEWRRHPQPPRDRMLQDPTDLFVISPSNIYDGRKWKPEAIAYFERRLIFAAGMAVYAVIGFIVIDWIW